MDNEPESRAINWINLKNIENVDFEFIIPKSIVFGCNSADKTPEYIRDLCGTSGVIVTSRGMVNRSRFKRLIDMLRRIIDVHIVYSIQPEPSVDESLKCAEFACSNGCDIVIGIGGGSVLDVAKKVGMDMKIPKIMLPTTAGTGSEVTHESVLKVDGEKKAFIDKGLLPDVAIVDPEFAKTMPGRLIAISGIDALAHAIECYDSRKSNFMIKTIAFGAYQIIKGNLENAVKGDGKTIENMALGSLMAGMAFGNSGTALAHALSYPFSNDGMPHGEAVAMVLPYALEFNGFDPNITKDVKGIIRDLKLGKDVKWDISEMARTVLEDKRHLSNNPRDVTYKDIVGIYERIRDRK